MQSTAGTSSCMQTKHRQMQCTLHWQAHLANCTCVLASVALYNAHMCHATCGLEHRESVTYFSNMHSAVYLYSRNCRSQIIAPAHSCVNIATDEPVHATRMACMPTILHAQHSPLSQLPASVACQLKPQPKMKTVYGVCCKSSIPKEGHVQALPWQQYILHPPG